jgi:hypothetical protein
MMTRHLQRDGHWVRKTYLSAPSEQAERIAKLSLLLAARGLRTPVGFAEPGANAVRFLWISGISGRDFLARHTGGTGCAPSHWTSLYQKLLIPLSRLHDISPQGLDLAPHDPCAKIVPRLGSCSSGSLPSGSVGPFADVLKELQGVLAEAEALSAPRDRVIVHGDFHIGQVLLEEAKNRTWLLDLDDLGLHCRESDLGNFAAHLATCGLLPERDPAILLRELLPQLATAYRAQSGKQLDDALLWAHAGLALLRRALKFHENKRPAQEVALALDAACTATRSTAKLVM